MKPNNVSVHLLGFERRILHDKPGNCDVDEKLSCYPSIYETGFNVYLIVTVVFTIS